MSRKKIRFGLIGLGLMGREFASSVARWCHLLDDSPVPEITAICSGSNKDSWKWYQDNFESIKIATLNYKDLLESDEVDAIYCAVPHHLHEQMYIDIIKSGKHLLAEKPFGIDQKANEAILKVIDENPKVIVRCSSEFPYFPGAQRVVQFIEEGNYGQIIEVRAGFHHSSDLDLNKAINWKRMIEFNGEYGCMGDLGFHTHHIPIRAGWKFKSVYAELQNIATTRPDGKGGNVDCETWDNATLLCNVNDPKTDKDFAMILETKRMFPGATNTWFIEVIGTKASAKFSTHDPKAFVYSETKGKEQAWTRVDIGAQSAIPSITGGIFEYGFSDAFQQMIGAFMQEFSNNINEHPFPMASPKETAISHGILTAALESHKTGKRISIK